LENAVCARMTLPATAANWITADIALDPNVWTKS
jgi:hypothetical protein